MAIIDTLFMTKTDENPTLWGRTYLYSPYKGVPPREYTINKIHLNCLYLDYMVHLQVHDNCIIRLIVKVRL